MTVKELRETLNSFHDNCIVMIPKYDQFLVVEDDGYVFQYTEVDSVSQGVNELDGIVFLEGPDED